MPNDSDIDTQVSLPALLAPGNDVKRFDAERAARIHGFIVNVKSGGKETCNCASPDAKDWDTHIEIALAPDAPEQQRAIVEVTPRIRTVMAAKGLDWTTAALHSKYKGKWVEVTGWLLFDFAHVKEAENTWPNHPGNWRATCWEIHPVTDLKLLPQAPPAAAAFQPASFAALQALHGAHLAAMPHAQEAIHRTHRSFLSKLDSEEREEIEEEASARRKK